MSVLIALAAAGAVMNQSASRLNDFGLKLLHGRTQAEPTYLFSPISASAAMTLLLEASGGSTTAALRGAMNLQEGSQEAEVEGVGDVLRSLAQSPGQEATVANAVFAPPGLRLDAAFVTHAKNSLGAQIETLTGGAAQVNAWVSGATKQRIRQLFAAVPNGSIVLANAVTFDGKWKFPFLSHDTNPLTFHATGGDQEVPTMQRTFRLTYRETSGYKEVELPYRGDQFSMRVMLPDSGDPRRILESLSSSLPSAGESKMVELTLPKFTFSSDTDLRAPLSNLGLGQLFSHVDISRMCPSHPVTKIGAAIQKAWIQVDESGTKAAAATGIMMPRMVMARPTAIPFHVDRPFAFAIQDMMSGTILFAGVVRRVP